MFTSEIIRKAEEKAAGSSYAYFVQCLQEVGILYYDVSLTSGTKTYFFKSAERIVLHDFEPVICSETFNEQAVVRALRRTQSGETTYHQFLAEIGDAGVHSYVADLESRTVIYAGHNSNERYTEAIP